MGESTLFNIDHQLINARIVNFAKHDSINLSVHQNVQFQWLEMNNTVQTVMDLTTPYKPVLPHMHGMLLALYYMSNPKSVLELGLGGGALQRFFYRYFPKCQMTSIELNKKIIEYFYDYFSAGWKADKNHVVKHQDAQKAVKQHREQDLLFIDLFSGYSSPDFMHQKAFFEDCVNALSKKGLLVINLLPISEIQTLDIEMLLADVTGFSPQIYSIPQYRNRIFICGHQKLKPLLFEPKLQQMCTRFHLNLMNIVQLK